MLRGMLVVQSPSHVIPYHDTSQSFTFGHMAGLTDHVGVASCVAHTLIAATRGKNLTTITEHVLPAAEAISWAPLWGSQLMVDVVSSLGAWPSMGLGASAERVISCITRAGSFGHFGAPYTSACTFRLADFSPRAATPEEIRGSRRDVANRVGLPEGPAAHTPREFWSFTSVRASSHWRNTLALLARPYSPTAGPGRRRPHRRPSRRGGYSAMSTTRRTSPP